MFGSSLGLPLYQFNFFDVSLNHRPSVNELGVEEKFSVPLKSKECCKIFSLDILP